MPRLLQIALLGLIAGVASFAASAQPYRGEGPLHRRYVRHYDHHPHLYRHAVIRRRIIGN